jgi:outer membrane protein assembly factor BamB
MTGEAKEQLPDTFDPLGKVGTGNLLWKTPVNGRSAPLVMDGKLYTLNAYDPGKLTEGERVTCMDAATGKVLWHYAVNVYHAEVVTSRLGWTTLAADPEKKRVYAYTTAGALLCLDDAGKLVWQQHGAEEFGRFTGYGGRICSPVCDSGLVVISVINSSWGDQAKGTNRFIAFEAATGAVVWITEPDVKNFGTFQSTPVIAVINGQRLLISGTSGGSVVGMKVRTGEVVFRHTFGAGPINPSPVVDGTLVYSAHGEENPGGGNIGRVVCVDAAQVNEKSKQPKLVWEYRGASRFGLSHPAVADGRLYIPDDSGDLFCFAGKGDGSGKAKLLWKYKYGQLARGAPFVNGDKLYIFDVNGKMAVLTLKGDQKPDADDTQEFTFRPPTGGQMETHGTPIAVNGRLYFTTQFDTYCIGDPKAKPAEAAYKPMPEEAKYDPKAKPAGVRIFPYEVRAKPGEKVTLKAVYFDANGRDLPAPSDAKGAWSLPLPDKTPTGAQPPALAGEIRDGVISLPPAPPGQSAYVAFEDGELKARGRVRVVPQLGYKADFEKAPVGSAPGGWVNAQGKFAVKEVEIGGKKEKVLAKTNTDGRIPIARANGYITASSATGYTIESDLYATEVDEKLPDMGVVANRYTMVMDGKFDREAKGRTIRLVSWEARPRINVVVPFDWKKETWYRAKLTVEVKEKTAVIRGKVWERGTEEPAKWTVEFEDPSPNREGAAAVYGYISNILNDTAPGSEIYYDNVAITPNGPVKPGETAKPGLVAPPPEKK